VRWRWAAFAAGQAGIAGVALARRIPGLDPPSLFPDDTWVGFLVRFTRPLDLLTYNASVPLGFVALQKPFAWLDPDPERSLQWLPLACGIATLPLLGLLVRRFTGSAAFGLLASALLAVNVLHVRYSIRVKQFTADGLVVTALLLVGLPLLARPEVRRATRLAFVGLAGVLVSWVSALPAAWLLNGAALRALVERQRLGGAWRLLALALGFDTALGVYTLTRLRYQTRNDIEGFWADYYLPLDSPGGALRFLDVHGAHALGWAFPSGLERVGAALAAAGLGVTLWRRETRGAGLVLAAVPAAALAASARGLYPVGGGRTDLFLYPIWILLACVGMKALGEALAVAWPGARRAASPLAAAAVLVLLAAHPRSSQLGRTLYPRSQDASTMAQLERLRGPDDHVLLHAGSLYVYAYYGTDPVEPRFERSRTRRSSLRPLHPGVAIASPATRPPFPSGFLEGRGRVLYLSKFPKTPDETDLLVAQALEAAGFERTRSMPTRHSVLSVFERRTDAAIRARPAQPAVVR
jgi:hypothetical protein